MAMMASGMLGWLSISVEISPLRAKLAVNSALKVYCNDLTKNLMCACFCRDGSTPDNWDGISIFYLWDAAFCRLTFEGGVKNIARLRSTDPVVLVTSSIHLNEKQEKRKYGTTRNEIIAQYFEVIENPTNVTVTFCGGQQRNRLVIWPLKKKLNNKVKALHSVEGPSILERAKEQLGSCHDTKMKNFRLEEDRLDKESGGRGVKREHVQIDQYTPSEYHHRQKRRKRKSVKPLCLLFSLLGEETSDTKSGGRGVKREVIPRMLSFSQITTKKVILVRLQCRIPSVPHAPMR